MSQQTVIIENEESLYTLASRVYGDDSMWREVGDKIGRSVFDPLITGEKIVLPGKEELLNLAKKTAQTTITNELKKRYPDLDLSVLKGIPGSDKTDGNLGSLIEWIL